MTNNQETQKLNKWIIVLSTFIPLAVAALFFVKIPTSKPLHWLPPIYATLNGITAVLLVVAVLAIKNKKKILHQNLMKMAILCSLLFLVLYIVYHITTPSTKFGSDGAIRYIYFFILISHILLSIAVLPLVMITYVKAWSMQFKQHKKIAKITFPLWLYVAITGVVAYLMIAPYYQN